MGLSAILMQGRSVDEAEPVAFASRATTDVENRYPQLDLEALSIDFGLRRFRYYIVGVPSVDIITDHKPLVSIFNNTRVGSMRTARIKLRHQGIKFKVSWRKGGVNPADYLSRHAIPTNKLSRSIQEESCELEKNVWFLNYGPYVESISMERIIEDTDKDDTLRQLKESIKQGFITQKQTGTICIP